MKKNKQRTKKQGMGRKTNSKTITKYKKKKQIGTDPERKQIKYNNLHHIENGKHIKWDN